MKLVAIDGGCTRRVLLIGSWAIKLPRFGYGWEAGLRGLLCNMQEARFARIDGQDRLCPVLCGIWGGWALVMRRARPLTGAEWAAFDFESFVEVPDERVTGGAWRIPAENKEDSFGILNGRVVAIDYGS